MAEIPNPFEAPVAELRPAELRPIRSRWAPLRWFPASLCGFFGLSGILLSGIFLVSILLRGFYGGWESILSGSDPRTRWIRQGLIIPVFLIPGGVIGLFAAHPWMRSRWLLAIAESALLFASYALMRWLSHS